ncbi:putative nucleotidyltransferase [Paenibacillus phyllosphaerae]|uniref:Putative nucleotidyltransferase n=1 Tax=Paenibacillus phyllosphaerae TaxID=274593 RepID=A0A7W5AV73_9BACL|nr:nucleotidyltransferase domain-containing protein [Paenibacillus phyllosphaerae]MBB3109119.1 putative nucleotidyltransferase [Paenibacillus phyllosphaerae]
MNNLTPIEQQAIYELISMLKRYFKVKQVILFGCKSRGDYNIDSDIDVVIIVGEERTTENRWKVSDIQFENNLKYDVPISCRYYSENDWNAGVNANAQCQGNVLKEGINIKL